MEATEVADDLLAEGWAAPAPLEPEPRDLPAAVAAALPEAMRSHLAANVELARQLVLAEQERDEALETAAREHAENRRLHERVAMQGQTIAGLRRQLAIASTGAVVERIDDALSGPCACLAAGAPRSEPAATPWGQPQRGRWVRWVRPQ